YPPRWAGMIVPLQIFAVFGLVNAVVATTGDVFKATNRPGWIPGLALVHFPTLIFLLWLLTPYGPAGAASALVLAASASGTVALAATIRILGVSTVEFAAALWPQALATSLMGAVVSALRPTLMALPGPVVLIGLVACGIPVYAATLYLVGRERWHELTTAFRDALPVRA